MIRIRLHVPGFVTVEDNFRYEYEAETWEELLKTERLAFWNTHPELDHWCLSENHLMVQMQSREGKRGAFWVVAYVREGLLPLPQWVDPGDEPT
jgi:hypothetical protein